MIAVTLDEWKKKLESPSREIIILHNPKVRRAWCIDQEGHPFSSLEGLSLCSGFMLFLLTTSAEKSILSKRHSPRLPAPE